MPKASRVDISKMPKAPHVDPENMPDPQELGNGKVLCMVPGCRMAAATKGCTEGHYYNMHVNYHTGETPWECGYCDMAFVGPDKRSRHEKLVHNAPRQYRGRGVTAYKKKLIALGMKPLPPTGHRRHVAPASEAGTEAQDGFTAVAACDLPNRKAPRRRRKAAPASGARAPSSPTPSTIPSAPLEHPMASSSSAPPPFPAFDAAQALARVASSQGYGYPPAVVQSSRDAQAAQAYVASNSALGYPGPSSIPQQGYAYRPRNSAIPQQYRSAQAPTAGPGPATSFPDALNGAPPKGKAPRRGRKDAPASGVWAEAQDGFILYQPPVAALHLAPFSTSPVAPCPSVVEQPTQPPWAPPPGRALDQTPYSAPLGVPGPAQDLMHPTAPQSYLDAPRGDGYAQSEYAFFNNGFLPHHAGAPSFSLGGQEALATAGAGPSHPYGAPQPSAVSMSRAWSSSSEQSSSSTSSAPRARASHRRQQSAPGPPTQSLRRTAIHRRHNSAHEPYYHPQRNAPVSPPHILPFAQEAFNFPPIPAPHANAAFSPFYPSDEGTPSLSGGSSMSNTPASYIGMISPSMPASEFAPFDPFASCPGLSASGSLFAHPEEGHYHALPQGWESLQPLYGEDDPAIQSLPSLQNGSSE